MAKRPEVKLTSSTTPPQARLADVASTEVPATGRTVSIGVGLKESEVQSLDSIAEDAGLRRNALMRFAIRYFLKEYYAGRVDLSSSVETETKHKLRMP